MEFFLFMYDSRDLFQRMMLSQVYWIPICWKLDSYLLEEEEQIPGAPASLCFEELALPDHHTKFRPEL